jgi:N-acetyl-anhydromuramyl-L-alanine amidase AmpD
MDIINVNYAWKSEPIQRKTTEWIILHHTGTSKDNVDNIHRWHRDNNGWSGFGYHYFITKDGLVYGGRPLNTQGVHTANYNYNSIGICFEGNYEVEQMPSVQVEKGIELIRWVREMYPETRIARHKDLNKSDCPGKNFRDDIIIKAMEVKEKSVTEEDVEFTETLKYLERFGEPTAYKEIAYRLKQILQNSFETNQFTREQLRDIFRK